MLTVRAKKGNPIITGESPQNRIDYDKVSNHMQSINVFVILNVNNVQIITEHGKKSFPYAKDVSVDWLTRKVDIMKENIRLKYLLNKVQQQ